MLKGVKRKDVNTVQNYWSNPKICDEHCSMICVISALWNRLFWINHVFSIL